MVRIITISTLSVAVLGSWYALGSGTPPAIQQAATQANQQASDDYYDIGGLHYKASTESPQAQVWFDRGLAMCHGFNHEEAVRCFQKALQADPSMAMALWGMAYAMGPNINNMEIEPHLIAQARFALQLAELHSEGCTELERDLIAALIRRYPAPTPPVDERGPANQAYADAMRDIHQKHVDDPLVPALLAESLMNLNPWNQWTPEGEAAEGTAEIVDVLETALERWPDQPLLCHLYIHAVEASPHPEKALAAADRLLHLMPGSGHLVHMPSHIYVLVGDYAKVIYANSVAIELDKQFLEREGPLNFYSLYRIHNYHFLVYGAMFDGQRDLAMSAAREIPKQVPEVMLRDQTDFLDAFMPMPLHVMIRFGRWEDILDEPEPADYLPMSRATWHYARALAYAATERAAEAEAEQQKFLAARDVVPETSFLFQNPSLNILGVAEAMIAGEVEYRKGNYEQAFEHLREAVRRDDALNYDEPWGWMQPARHALGALLLEQGQLDEAAAVYQEDQRRRPNNPWSLAGLADCLEQQGKMAEAKQIREQLGHAAKRADVPIDRSCFCKIHDK
ncbi:MAG: tetratricopeptide repeat protein [Pirellulaceae bacterium]